MLKETLKDGSDRRMTFDVHGRFWKRVKVAWNYSKDFFYKYLWYLF